MPWSHYAWKPSLLLETAAANSTIPAKVHMELEYGPHPHLRIRPYSFTFELPPNATAVFRISEASYPGHKVEFLLPANSSVCHALAPTEHYSAAAPALWTVISPIRHHETLPSSMWEAYYANVAVRVANWLTYHLALGVAGLMLYEDAIAQSYLRHSPALAKYMVSGKLRLVRWELGERYHDLNDGLDSTALMYCYDQALVASHALLGMSACGTNLMAMVSDIDEYLYIPDSHTRWPGPLHSCMLQQSNRTGVFRLQRMEVLSTKVAAADEPAMWAKAFDQPFAGGDRFAHPLACYDLITKSPIQHSHSKNMAYPASFVIDYFVHEGFPLHGEYKTMPTSCIMLLHIRNFMRNRTETINPDEYDAFAPWFAGEQQCTFDFGATGQGVEVQRRLAGNRLRGRRLLQ